ncbi:alpha/beta hydrolase [Bifidobacterium aemilianum]|uniref:Alpha/beta hydrolase n=2 Tax=Bifidobacterium aemilianum TaxID=2493120 RepID=A0A366K9Z1_9BIFI|nr:alpha/beta hydrolase [Bifidobacterium aemilianum]
MTLHNTIYREGSGLPLVLVHAFPVDHRMWDACAQELSRLTDEAGMAPFPIWAPDMPGSGHSPVPDSAATGPVAADGSYPQALDAMAKAYLNLLHEGGQERAIWVGLSMGGYLVMDMQRLFPEAVAGLALCDTTAKADDDEHRANRLRVASQALEGQSTQPVMHFAQPQSGDSTVKRSPAFIETMTAWIKDQSPEGIAWRQRMAAGRPDLMDQLARITAPAALVSGDLDPSSPPSVMEPLAQAMIGTQPVFTRIADCGHFSAVEHPDQLAQALLALVQRVS